MSATQTLFTQTIFERSTDYPTGMVASTIVLLIAIAFVVLSLMRRRPLEKQAAVLQRNHTIIPQAPFCLKIAGFVALLGLAAAVPNLRGWWTLRADLQTEKITTVEGAVTKAETWQTGGRRKDDTVHTHEAIEVNGRGITYRSIDVGAPYPLVEKNGGALRVGKPVRITFAGDAIIRIEI